MIKQFKTLDEQIDILKSKGLEIEDYDYTKEVLFRENYFFVSGYRHLFLKTPQDRMFIKGTTFNELYALFRFDRHMRNIIFKNILILENNMKSVMSYVLSKNYGIKERSYLDPKNFSRDSEKAKQINDLLKKMKRQIRVNGKQHSATSHYLNNYGYVPLWIVVKVLSFGIVSEFFSILKKDDQEEIAKAFSIEPDDLIIYLSILANYRNLCAHEDILYDHVTQREIDDTKYHYFLGLPLEENEYVYGKNDLFALVIILKRLLTDDNFTLFISEVDYELSLLQSRLHTIEIDKVLHKIGFPVNFKEIVGMSEYGKKE